MRSSLVSIYDNKDFAEKIAHQVKTIYADDEETKQKEEDPESDVSIGDLLDRAESINYKPNDPSL